MGQNFAVIFMTIVKLICISYETKPHNFQLQM